MSTLGPAILPPRRRPQTEGNFGSGRQQARSHPIRTPPSTVKRYESSQPVHVNMVASLRSLPLDRRAPGYHLTLWPAICYSCASHGTTPL